MHEPIVLITILCTFLLAGAVKGVIGLGLPTVSLGLLTAALDLPTAMALLLVPSLVTNLWQAAVGGNGVEIIRRIWPFLLTATVTVWIGATALTRVDLSLLSALLGALLVTYAVISLGGIRFAISKGQEVRAGLVIGTVNGVLTGMTGSFVVPGVMFLQAIGLPRDMLIQAMGMLFAASTVSLAISLEANSILNFHLGILSSAALVPAIAGMMLGQMVRQQLSEHVFRRVFFSALLALGAYIMASATIGLR